MDTKRIGLLIFLIGAVYIVGMSWFASWWVVPTFRNLSPAQISETIWTKDSPLLRVWSFSIPIGATLSGVGMLIYAQSKKSRTALFGIGVFLLGLVIGLLQIPYYPPLFGALGGLVVIFFLAILWFWGKKRTSLEGPEKTAADFLLVGYVFFFVAAWFLCGLLGPPGYLLYPDKVIQFNTLASARSSALLIFIYLVLGWLFTFLSHHKTAQAKE